MNHSTQSGYSITGLMSRRLVHATGFSLAGLRRAWDEEAFRVEFGLATVLLPAAGLVGNNALEIAMLILSLFLVLIVEVLNTAVEVTIDRISTEMHPISGAAKDLGSAAVLLSIGCAVAIWSVIWWF